MLSDETLFAGGTNLLVSLKEISMPVGKESNLFHEVTIIPDPIHGRVGLSMLEKTFIVDTPEFQRLKDIRQLTCQQVYPSARHTRFEHSLGVFELTKQAVENLNENAPIGENPEGWTREDCKFSNSEKLNVRIAALLHDIGHCPFSHMGEAEMEKGEAHDKLLESLRRTGKESNIDSFKPEGEFYRTFKKESGSTHEMISCVIFLTKYLNRLNEQIEVANEGIDKESGKVTLDPELVVRCILGLDYDVSILFTGKNAVTDRLRKNILIRLISSSMLDMDKIDYIMRDSFFTGVDVPKIDVTSLFRNMHISYAIELVFTSRAVPVLQNLIEARNNLYLWVYNHHVTVYSDFLYGYIFRRLDINARKTNETLKKNGLAVGNYPDDGIGDYPKDKLFSVDAIIRRGVSDSDLIQALRRQYRKFIEAKNEKEENKDGKGEHIFRCRLLGCEENASEEEVENKFDVIERKKRSLYLVKCLQERYFLKSWWKRPFELSTYLKGKFSIDPKELGKRVCYSKDKSFDSTEFRSQIAKHVLYLVNKWSEKYYSIDKILKDGEFFIVQRSNKFFGKGTIQKLAIYLRPNEVLTSSPNEKSNDNHYFKQSLTDLMPYKDYDEIYDENGFFLYVKRYEKFETSKIVTENRYYNLIDEAFVFVAKTFTQMRRENFMVRWYDFDKFKWEIHNMRTKIDKHLKDITERLLKHDEFEQATIKEEAQEILEKIMQQKKEIPKNENIIIDTKIELKANSDEYFAFKEYMKDIACIVEKHENNIALMKNKMEEEQNSFKQVLWSNFEKSRTDNNLTQN